MRQTFELKTIEQWMQAVITHPAGIPGGVASEEARRNIDVSPELIEQVVTRSKSLTATRRLAIYSHAYFARLQECLRAEFPILWHALGDKLFNLFTFDYLQHYPSRSYTLNRLGENFPSHLARTRPDAAAPSDARESWPDFIIELATLELAFLEVYDGPGIEGQLLPDVHIIRAIPAEHILALRPMPASCLRLFAFRYPVSAYFLAVRRKENPQLPAPDASFVAMTRRNYRVVLHELTSSQHMFLKALNGQHTVGEALNLQTLSAGFTAKLSENVQGWVCDCVRFGFFASVEGQEGRTL